MRQFWSFRGSSGAWASQLPSSLSLVTQPQLQGEDWSFILGAVYTAQVFTSNQTLLLRFSPPFTWQPRKCLKRLVPECNPLNTQPYFRLCKLTSGVPVNAATLTLMLMLAQVSAFCFSHYQTLINNPQCTQSKSNMMTVYWGKFECSYHNLWSQSTAEFL